MIHIIDGVFANHQLEKFSKTINRSTEPFVSGYASKKGKVSLKILKTTLMLLCATL